MISPPELCDRPTKLGFWDVHRGTEGFSEREQVPSLPPRRPDRYKNRRHVAEKARIFQFMKVPRPKPLRQPFSSRSQAPAWECLSGGSPLRTGTASSSGLDPGSSPRCPRPLIMMSTMGQSPDRSRSMRRFLVSRPPPKPISEPSLPIHRWHGTMIGMGFFPLAPPTALTALGLPIASARVL